MSASLSQQVLWRILLVLVSGIGGVLLAKLTGLKIFNVAFLIPMCVWETFDTWRFIRKQRREGTPWDHLTIALSALVGYPIITIILVLMAWQS